MYGGVLQAAVVIVVPLYVSLLLYKLVYLPEVTQSTKGRGVSVKSGFESACVLTPVGY